MVFHVDLLVWISSFFVIYGTCILISCDWRLCHIRLMELVRLFLRKLICVCIVCRLMMHAFCLMHLFSSIIIHIRRIVWAMLFLELAMEVFIRPTGYYKLIRSEKAYLPSTVRYIGRFHLITEMISLIFFVPEFLCLFSSTWAPGIFQNQWWTWISHLQVGRCWCYLE